MVNSYHERLLSCLVPIKVSSYYHCMPPSLYAIIMIGYYNIRVSYVGQVLC